MSILLMAHVFDLDITAPQKLVLLVMANYANDEGENVYPSQENIANKTSQTRRGVVNIVQQLTELGYVSIVGKKGGRQNVYKLSIEKIMPDVNPVHSRCEPRSHNPLINQLKENKDLKDLKDSIESEPGSQQKRETWTMMTTLSNICGLVIRDNSSLIGRYAKTLLKLGYTPEDVMSFTSWWSRNDWRGRQGQAPTPAQVQQLIGSSKLKAKSTEPTQEDIDRAMGEITWNKANE